jgi:hypothetical protein
LTSDAKKNLRDQLPLQDRKLVDDTLKKSAARVALAYNKQSDLIPPLGYPGGPCHVIDRIETKIQNPMKREEIIDDVEMGEALTNEEASHVYEIETDIGPRGTRIKRLLISPHAQYRMDLRGVTVPLIRAAIYDFFQNYSAEKSRGSVMVRSWEEKFSWGEPINWFFKKLGLHVVFVVTGTDARIVTTYWNEGDPRPPGEGGCE